MFIDWILTIINLLLLIVTILTVKYANRTLHMEYSTQVIVKNTTIGSSIKKYYPFYWNVSVKNVGKGYIVKAFILLTVKRKDSNLFKFYYLSKPIIDIHPSEEKEILLELGEDDIIKGHFKDAKLEVIYQDSLGNIYTVKPVKKGWNVHLETFDKLPKRMSKFRLLYWVYLIKLKISVRQGNTSTGRFRKEIDKQKSEDENGFNFKRIQPPDTK